jgi:hypothetical protein
MEVLNDRHMLSGILVFPQDLSPSGFEGPVLVDVGSSSLESDLDEIAEEFGDTDSDHSNSEAQLDDESLWSENSPNWRHVDPLEGIGIDPLTPKDRHVDPLEGIGIDPNTPKDRHVDPLEGIGIDPNTPKDRHVDPLEGIGIDPLTPKDRHVDPLEGIGIDPLTPKRNTRIESDPPILFYENIKRDPVRGPGGNETNETRYQYDSHSNIVKIETEEPKDAPEDLPFQPYEYDRVRNRQARGLDEDPPRYQYDGSERLIEEVK